MKKNLLLVAVLLASSFGLKAQEKDKPMLIPLTEKSDTLVRHTWEVGTDLLWLIDKNTIPFSNVFARKNIVTKNGRFAALRARVGLDFSRENSVDIEGLGEEDYFNLSPFIRLGYEWQIQKNKLQFFYGVDLNILYQYNYNTYEDIFGSTGERKLKNLEIGPVGFIGAKYFLSSNISLSTEISYDLIYQNYQYNGRDSGTFREDKRSGISGSFKPLYILNINYHF